MDWSNLKEVRHWNQLERILTSSSVHRYGRYGMVAALRNLRVYTFGGGAFIVGNKWVQKSFGDIRPLL